MDSNTHPFLTILVPTYNETENVRALLRGFKSLKSAVGFEIEILVVDDNSPDGTPLLVRSVADEFGLPVRVIVRRSPRSMGRSIVEGMVLAKGDVICVMDADLSHPSAILPAMIDHLNGFDGVVASRYAKGGTIAGWPLRRRAISLVATWLARKSVGMHSSDPLSGFFLFRRSSLDLSTVSGTGNKPLVEILADDRLTVIDIPYEFRDRQKGKSKLGLLGVMSFVGLILLLWSGRPNSRLERSPPATDPLAQSREQ